jgi:exodeoxyribonuclease VII large subunit
MLQDTTTKIFSVSEITDKIKRILEPSFNGVTIQGEISNFKRQSSGHFYFSLKDKSSQISTVFFRGNNQFLTRMPKDGDQVIVIGDMSVYSPRGNYQLIIRELKFAGVGELLLKLHELKNELKKLNYFDESRKKKLPAFPKKIGIVTSPTGAVIKDILNVLERRSVNFELLLNPVRVQGELAAAEIAMAINDFNKYQLADVLIVGRGGGSLEDLWPFNEKIVADAIFASKIPIISAVGHETDYTIADLVADKRAPTPSAAAEIVSKEINQITTFLQNTEKNIYNNINLKLNFLKQRYFDLVNQPAISKSYALLAKRFQDIDESQNNYHVQLKFFLKIKKEQLLNLNRNLKAVNPILQCKLFKEKILNYQKNITNSMITQINHEKVKFDQIKLQEQLKSYLLALIDKKKQKIAHLKAVFEAIDPKNLLEKGYSIIFSEKLDSVISSIKDIKKNDRLQLRVKDGIIISCVELIKPDGKDG